MILGLGPLSGPGLAMTYDPHRFSIARFFSNIRALLVTIPEPFRPHNSFPPPLPSASSLLHRPKHSITGYRLFVKARFGKKTSLTDSLRCSRTAKCNPPPGTLVTEGEVTNIFMCQGQGPIDCESA